MKNHPSTIYMDLDGTLCPIKNENQRYEDLPPDNAVVESLRAARTEGYRVVIFSARNMRTFDGDLSRITTETGPVVMTWLNKHKIPYDGLLLGKPWPGPRGFYVDDRTVRPDEFVELNTGQILVKLDQTKV